MRNKYWWWNHICEPPCWQLITPDSKLTAEDWYYKFRSLKICTAVVKNETPTSNPE